MTSFLDSILIPTPVDEAQISSHKSLGTFSRNSQVTSNDIIYSRESNNEIPRDVLLQYLRDCSFMILQPENISDIISDSDNLKIGLQESAVKYQQGYHLMAIIMFCQ